MNHEEYHHLILKTLSAWVFKTIRICKKKIFHIQIVLWCLFQSNEQTPHFCTFLYIISHSTQEYNLPRWWSSSVPRLYAQKPHLPSTARNTSVCLLFSPQYDKRPKTSRVERKNNRGKWDVFSHKYGDR